jgi:glycosyltransferase involved in cell wall biosynthesis
MSLLPRICFTFVGDATRDSRLRRHAVAAASQAEVFVLQLPVAAQGGAVPAGDRSVQAESDPAETGSTLQGMKDVVMQELWEEEGDGRIKLLQLPLRGSLRSTLPRFWRHGFTVSREIACDLFVAADLYSLPAAARAARAARVPLGYDARELYCSVAALKDRRLMQRFWRWVEKRYACRARIVTTVNDSIAALLRERHDDVRVVRNVPDFPLPMPSQRIRDHCGIPDYRRILLSQGGLQRGRGAFILIHLMEQLPECHLVFLGDGVLQGELEVAARFSGVAERVSFIPAVPSGELPSWTTSADLGMCLIEDFGQSYYLSLPNKLFEYLAAGIPVVGSDFPEIGPLLRETAAGIAVNPADTDMVLRAIRTLLNDDGRYERSRQACLEARATYHWDVEREFFLRILGDLLPRA